MLCRLLRRHFKLRGLLEGESVGSVGQGSYNPDVADPTEAGAMSSTLWELCLLQLHYHPHIAQSAAAVSGIPPEGGPGILSGPLNSVMGPADLAEAYDAGSGSYPL